MKKTFMIFMIALMMVGGMAFGASTGNVTVTGTVPTVLECALVATGSETFNFVAQAGTSNSTALTAVAIANIAVATNVAYDFGITTAAFELSDGSAGDEIPYSLGLYDSTGTAVVNANITATNAAEVNAHAATATQSYRLDLTIPSFNMTTRTALAAYADAITLTVAAD